MWLSSRNCIGISRRRIKFYKSPAYAHLCPEKKRREMYYMRYVNINFVIIIKVNISKKMQSGIIIKWSRRQHWSDNTRSPYARERKSISIYGKENYAGSTRKYGDLLLKVLHVEILHIFKREIQQIIWAAIYNQKSNLC